MEHSIEQLLKPSIKISVLDPDPDPWLQPILLDLDLVLFLYLDPSPGNFCVI